MNGYLENPTGLTEDCEELNKKDKAAEEAMLRLRLLVEGIEVSELTARFGQGNIKTLISHLEYMVSRGQLVADGSKYRLPSFRVLTSNPIFAEVLAYNPCPDECVPAR